MVKVDVALVVEQGVRFAVVKVKKYAVDSQYEFNRTVNALTPVFGVPIVLCSIDNRGRAHYRGRRDIVNWLVNINWRLLPWKEYNLN